MRTQYIEFIWFWLFSRPNVCTIVVAVPPPQLVSPPPSRWHLFFLLLLLFVKTILLIFPVNYSLSLIFIRKIRMRKRQPARPVCQKTPVTHTAIGHVFANGLIKWYRNMSDTMRPSQEHFDIAVSFAGHPPPPNRTEPSRAKPSHCLGSKSSSTLIL